MLTFLYLHADAETFERMKGNEDVFIFFAAEKQKDQRVIILSDPSSSACKSRPVCLKFHVMDMSLRYVISADNLRQLFSKETLILIRM